MKSSRTQIPSEFLLCHSPPVTFCVLVDFFHVDNHISLQVGAASLSLVESEHANEVRVFTEQGKGAAV